MCVCVCARARVLHSHMTDVLHCSYAHHFNMYDVFLFTVNQRAPLSSVPNILFITVAGFHTGGNCSTRLLLFIDKVFSLPLHIF